jgi:hypothetical protein
MLNAPAREREGNHLLQENEKKKQSGLEEAAKASSHGGLSGGLAHLTVTISMS